MDGLLNILKPPGMTSHDVVNYIRRLAGIKKVGHTGTLDPGAAGVLLVCCGRATRLIEYLDHDKQYRAEITFGVVSSTGDSFGELREGEIPGGFSRDLVAGILPFFTGAVSQVPPMTSAVRHRGKKLYELSRQGVVVDRRARTVKIYSLEMVKWYGCKERPRALLDVRCSAGTYIRTLCHDIGERLGCGAYMSFLLRTGVGKFLINGASTMEELKELAGRDRLPEAVVSVEEALSFFPAVEINEGAVNSVRSGATLHPPGVRNAPEGVRQGDMVTLTAEGRVLAVARAAADDKGRISFKPEKVLV
ncbi:MAG: tRNA pseudouridine(55) synthase TruB [Bacillota bacterium]